MNESQELLTNLLNSMPLDNIQDVIENAGDDTVWRPFYADATILENFTKHVQLVEESKTWPKKRNKEKGDILEGLMKLVFSRFCNVFSFERSLTTDNEIDLNIKFSEVLSPTFIQGINSYLICECKNVTSSSINVGTVTKLVELCCHNKAGMGIFVSLRGISGRGWKYGEGKRRKLFLSEKIPIISFTFEEIKKLNEPGINFYSLIKRKYQQLVDEVDYDGQAISDISQKDPDFMQFLLDTIYSLQKINILTTEEYTSLCHRITERYGEK